MKHSTIGEKAGSRKTATASRSAVTTAISSLARFSRYIERNGACLEDKSGPVFISNIATTPAARAAWWTERGFQTRKGGRAQYRFIAELPHELPAARHRAIIQRFADQLEEDGLPYAIAVHQPEPGRDQRNVHAHGLFDVRPMPTEENPSPKILAKTRSKNWIAELRQNWTEAVNAELASAREPKRYHSISNKKAGITKRPGRHLGGGAAALERRGLPTRLGVENAWTEIEWLQSQPEKADHVQQLLHFERARRAIRWSEQELALTGAPAASRARIDQFHRSRIRGANAYLRQAERTFGPGRSAIEERPLVPVNQPFKLRNGASVPPAPIATARSISGATWHTLQMREQAIRMAARSPATPLAAIRLFELNDPLAQHYAEKLKPSFDDRYFDDRQRLMLEHRLHNRSDLTSQITADVFGAFLFDPERSDDRFKAYREKKNLGGIEALYWSLRAKEISSIERSLSAAAPEELTRLTAFRRQVEFGAGPAAAFRKQVAGFSLEALRLLQLFYHQQLHSPTEPNRSKLLRSDRTAQPLIGSYAAAGSHLAASATDTLRSISKQQPVRTDGISQAALVRLAAASMSHHTSHVERDIVSLATQSIDNDRLI